MSYILEEIQLDSKIIAEVKRPGRECIYDKNHKDYKNNCKKVTIWTEIANSVGIPKGACQKKWKLIRQKYKKNLMLLSQGRELKTPCQKWVYKNLAFLDKYVKYSETSFRSKQLIYDKQEENTFYEEEVEEERGDNSLQDETFYEYLEYENQDPIKYLPQDKQESNEYEPTTSRTGKRKRLNNDFKKICKEENDFEEKFKRENDLEEMSFYIDKLEKLEKNFKAMENNPFTALVGEEMEKVPNDHKNSLKIKILELIYEYQEK